MNEAAGIVDCLDAIREAVAELGVPTEVIVSDSSTDETPELAREGGAIVVEPDREGYGYAYQYGFEHARGEYVVIGDADTTYDFRAIPDLLAPLQAGEADLVLGSRFAGEIEPGAMPNLHRYVGNPVLTWFLNRFYDAGVTDAHSGFRAIRRSALETLQFQTDGMEFASEMIMLATAEGLVIEEVPITYSERTGEATLDSFRDGWQHLRFMLLNAPTYLFSVPGATLAVIGAVIMLLAFLNVQITGLVGRELFGTRSMVAGSLLTLVGYQIASFASYAAVTSDPINRPRDRVTEWLLDNFRLGVGVTIGTVLIVVGAAYAGGLVALWLSAGYDALPRLTHDIFAFTIIVLGIQTIFSAFFLTLLRSM
jgi:hypothetical protein